MSAISLQHVSTASEDFYGKGADAKVANLAGITLDKIFGPLRAADRAAAAASAAGGGGGGGGGGSVVQPAVKSARSYAISSKVEKVISLL